MLRRYATMRPEASRADAESEAGLVHYEGVFILGSQTLCGHIDRTDFIWNNTKKRANCPGCLAVRDHVLGKRP